MLKIAKHLDISHNVFTIDSFLEKCIGEYPELIDYKCLSVKLESFSEIDVNDIFFDSLRSDYDGFNSWFNKKYDEKAYVCRDDKKNILVFLYIKLEDENEIYHDIWPVFKPLKRLKIGTFKVNSTGFRLGERFIKIIFDNAYNLNVDEIYVTLYNNNENLIVLKELLSDWGFFEYGKKINNNSENNEIVLVKKMNIIEKEKSVKYNFPNVDYNTNKFILPIRSDYHTRLFPDSKTDDENEIDFLGETPEKYALEKAYISFSYERNIKPGDFLIIYKMGKENTSKQTSSLLTTIGVVKSVEYGYKEFEKNKFFNTCKNRTVFTSHELEMFWKLKRDEILVIKFIYLKKMKEYLNLSYLWNKGIIEYQKGPRPFTRITNDKFDLILNDSKTEIKFTR
ncbi:hypothetical protein [Malacoplasma iowae]|uniref:hypothetical protein n=1 Tax=Malacoplasma iowae TaxID=2116 RepID=UPI0038739E0A|nr:hypothetical protein QX181_04990 [Malacoplasma iowae]